MKYIIIAIVIGVALYSVKAQAIEAKGVTVQQLIETSRNFYQPPKPFIDQFK